MSDEVDGEAGEQGARRTRRAFLAGAGVATAAAAVGLSAATGGEESVVVPADTEAEAFPPLPPRSLPPACTVTEFFTRDEAVVVDAIAARILPGDQDDPGAREACVVSYIDHKLASFDAFAEPTFASGPFPESDLPDEELARYGFQSSLTPQRAYRQGLAALDMHVRGRFGRPFAELGGDEADRVLMEMEDGVATGFDEPSADGFFEILRTDVIHGVFADPAYGGNVDLAGWRLIGYPGAQQGYTPVELRRGRTERGTQALDELPHTHPGAPSAGGKPAMQLPMDGVRG